MEGNVIAIGELVLRLFLATLIGALLGFDRELKGTRQAFARMVLWR
jgi:uncharacterized membrane protein YhiD involved in acid resistance